MTYPGRMDSGELPYDPELVRRPSLERVIGALTEQGVHVLAAAPEPQREVGESVIVGAGEAVPRTPDGVVLLAGNLSPDHQVDAVRVAVEAGCCAVFVKERAGQNPARATQTALEEGIALLSIPADMSWRHLDALLTASRTNTPDPGDALRPVGLGDFFALATAIASTLGGAVTIEDADGQVLGYSSLPHQQTDPPRRDGILGRRAAQYPRTKNLYRRVMTSEEPVLILPHRPEIATRLAMAVRAGGRVIGTIWVIADRPQLVPQARELLVSAAQITALHLLRARRHSDPERAARSEALRLLLDGSSDAQLAATRMGIAFTTPTVLVAVTSVDRQCDPVPTATRLIDVVSLQAQVWHPDASCAIDAGVVYALVPIADLGVSTIKQVAPDLVSAIARSQGIDAMIAIGPPAHTVAEVTRSRKLADKLLTVMAQTRRRTGSKVTVADGEGMRSVLLLHALAEHAELIDDLRLDSVAAIVDHDTANETSYGQTLTAFYGALGDTTRTAKDLIVHENTVRYRMRRAQEIFGVDHDDPDHILATWLQLRLLEIRGSQEQ